MFRDSLDDNVSTIGACRHAILWLTATTRDIVLPNPNFRPTADPIHVYCIHGTADGNSAFSLVAERLLPDLPSNIACIHLVAFYHRLQGKGIEEFATQLKDKMIANQHKKVILMGHSRGGLVGAYLAEYLAAASHINVKAVITIGTPFAGSDLAVAPFTWLSASVKQMQPKSAFLAALKAKLSTSTIHYHHFAAEQDAIVSQCASCIDGHQDQLVTFDRHGHLSVMSSHRLVERIMILLHQHAIQADCQQEDIEGRALNLASL